MVEVGRHMMFCSVYYLIELASLLPLVTSTVERAFSTINIIKSELAIRILMVDLIISWWRDIQKS